jgi:hypothetical protein
LAVGAGLALAVPRCLLLVVVVVVVVVVNITNCQLPIVVGCW